VAFLFFQLADKRFGGSFVAQAFHKAGTELALRHSEMRWRELAQIRSLFNIAADRFVAVFDGAFFVGRLRMAEEYRGFEEIGKLDMLLERNIVVDGQAADRIGASNSPTARLTVAVSRLSG
jgi:hypothetical protein